MREFHKTMFEHGVRLKYTDSGVEVFLDNSCTLKALKDIAEAFYVEFGTTSEKIRLESTNSYICMLVPVGNGFQAENEEITEVREEEEEEFSDRILNACLEVLSEHENGLTATELQRELAKKGIIATEHWISKLMTKDGRFVKVGGKWRLKASDDWNVKDSEDWNGWIPLTDSVGYRKDNNTVFIGLKRPNGKIETLKMIPYNLLEDLYKALPDEANSADVNAMATAVGIENTSNLETYLMRILASEFGGELQKLGRSLILIKGGSNA